MNVRHLPPAIGVALCVIALQVRAVEPSIVAVYDLQGSLSEGGQRELSLLSLPSSTGRPVTHFDLVRSLRMAAADEKVAGVVLEFDQVSFSRAQAQELSRRLADVRREGKKVWLFSDTLSRTSALFGSAADHFAMMPEGGVALIGLFGESLYFKGLLDKVGVQADVIHIGDFKSAGEAYYRQGPSAPARKQMDEIFDSFYIQPAGGFLCCVLIVSTFLAFLVSVFGLYFRFLERFFAEVKVRYLIILFVVVILASWAVTLTRSLAEK